MISAKVLFLYMQIKSVRLDQFVCNVSYPVCPSDCECIKIPDDRTYIVRCSYADELPTSLPDTEHPGPYKCRYHLEFLDSTMDVIDARDYFNNTVALNVSGSGVVNITDAAWRSLVGVSMIDLSFNKLTTLPRILQSENLTYKSLVLYQNPWRCQCGDQWMRDWMISLGERLILGNLVLCSSPQWNNGRSIRSLTDEQFCSDPDNDELSAMLKVSFCLIIVHWN